MSKVALRRIVGSPTVLHGPAVEGEPTTAGPRGTVGEPTMRRRAAFDMDQNHFFRVQQQVPLLSITSTNPTSLEWLSPELSMGDTLSNFIVRRRTSEVDLANPDAGWTECGSISPQTISPCPVIPDA